MTARLLAPEELEAIRAGHAAREEGHAFVPGRFGDYCFAEVDGDYCKRSKAHQVHVAAPPPEGTPAPAPPADATPRGSR